MYCAKCGAEQQPDARFCPGCGAEISAGQQPPPPPAKTGVPGWLIGCVIALVLLIVAIGTYLAIGFSRFRARPQAELPPPPEISKPGPEPPVAGPAPEPTPEPPVARPAPEPTPEPTPRPAPVVSSEDPVARATVVLENYLAADLGHDGNEMKKYLGGQAAARFRPDVQGQEDVVVHSERIASHTIKDASTIVFKVTVKFSPGENPGTEKTSTDSYILKKTEKGWLIFSTPAYP